MDTDRRTVVQGLGASAISLGLTAAATPARAQRTGRRKMIVRADDVGHSKVCNIGTFEAVDHGVVSAIAIMLDSPGTEDALERLRAYPWLSVEWHTHMWGAPVSDPTRVPSLVEHGGEFDGRFRTDLSRATDVSYEEALVELRAQVERCIRILGRAPSSGESREGSPWNRALTRVTADYGMAANYAGGMPTDPKYQLYVDKARKAGEEWALSYPSTPSPAPKVDPKWAGRKIYNLAGQTAYINLLTDSISSVEKNYNPLLFYTEDRSGILKTPTDWITMQPWHPGYVDYYVYRLGERVNRARAQQFVVGRTQDVAALTDPRLRAWIKQNGIELVSISDAIYDRRDFQNHLEAIASDLAV